jgi:hypothetical protein
MIWAASQPDLRKKCVVNLGMLGARTGHELFTLCYRLQSFKIGARVPNQAWNDVSHMMSDSFSS